MLRWCTVNCPLQRFNVQRLCYFVLWSDIAFAATTSRMGNVLNKLIPLDLSTHVQIFDKVIRHGTYLKHFCWQPSPARPCTGLISQLMKNFEPCFLSDTQSGWPWFSSDFDDFYPILSDSRTLI